MEHVNTPPPALVDALVQDCLTRESNIAWLYRDASANGWVTTAVGKKLVSAMEASRLPFRIGDRPASVAEVSSDFVRVLGLPAGRVATYYRSAQSPLLPSVYGEQLCRTELLGEYLPGIQRLVPDALSLPVPVVRALVTISYTSGLGGLAGFPDMLASLKARDYKGIVARKEFHMKATDATNERLRLWFVEASQPPTG